VSLRLAVHWTATLLVTAAALVLGPLPFTGRAAGAVGTVAAVAVLAIGTATTPTRKAQP
jgi:hypothetical protein